MVCEILETGLSQKEIADHVNGKSQAWVSSVANGGFQDLKWEDGQALIALHKRVCRRKKAA